MPRIVAIADFREDIDVARGELIVGGDGGMEAAVGLGNIVAETLTDEDIAADAGGTPIVVSGIFVGLAPPKIIGGDGVEEEADGEGLAHPRGREAAVPGYVAFLQGEGELGFIGMMAREEAEEHVRLPMFASAILPAGSEGEESDAAGILQTGPLGDEIVPALNALRA